jgi:hypothetical protein
MPKKRIAQSSFLAEKTNNSDAKAYELHQPQTSKKLREKH